MQVDTKTEYELKLIKLRRLEGEFYIPKGRPYFKPNIFSEFVIDALNKIDFPEGPLVIEIGAGIAPITVLLMQSQPNIRHLYSVEIDAYQYEAARRNIKHHELENRVILLQGDLFEPIGTNHPGLRAKLIFSDASGISNFWGTELEWYEEGISLGGEDGTTVNRRFLAEAPFYSSPDVKVCFPVLPNFSNGELIENTAREHFADVKRIARQNIPFSREEMAIINKYKEELYSPIEEKGSGGYWLAEFWLAENPKRLL